MGHYGFSVLFECFMQILRYYVSNYSRYKKGEAERQRRHRQKKKNPEEQEQIRKQNRER